MTEKDLLKKLNTYRDLKADSTWKKDNRAVLLNQIINSSSAPETGFSFSKITNAFKVYSDIFYNGIVKNLGQPVILTSMIVLTVLGGGIMSIQASRNTTPGDSLYIAKKISEKTQLAFTFSEKKKAQLNISFAKNRATEIAQVMSAEKPEEQKQEIVEQLKGDFKEEILHVKTRISKINEETKKEEVKDDSKEVTVEENMFTANLGKGKDGISISDSESTNIEETVPEKTEAVSPEESTSSLEIVETENASTTVAEEVKDDSSSKDILSEVNDLIENEDFDASLEKLDEVGMNFEEVDTGEVKGIMEEVNTEEAATSTEE